MTLYEELITRAEAMERRAIETNDCNLKRFYSNAGLGLRLKALSLTVREAGLKAGARRGSE